MKTTTLTGIRPSLWARCVTAAVFQGRGAPEAELEPEAREFWFRGHVFEEIVMRQIQAKHGRENVERQVEIPIPGIGTGHADGYLKPEKALVEIKSTVAAYPNSDTFGFGVEQLKRYLAYHGEAERGYLYMVDPSRMKPADVYTVVLTDEDRASIEDERSAIEDRVARPSHRFGPHGSPWRPCTNPNQARGRMCPFARVCFEGWVPDPAAEVTAPEALDAAARLAAIKTEKASHAAAVRALETDEKLAQAELAEHVEPGVAIVGPFEVKRTHVVMSPRFSEKAARAAGFPVESLAEFMTPGTEYDRWTVSAAAEAGQVDYGDEAPY